MFRALDHRAGHYLLLVAVWAACCLPNLGAPTLWDIDEGLNAEASREMLASGNYIVPTFNYQLRSAKPVLLYWLQAACYRLIGVTETAARLPSALAALLAALGTYELGRAMFGRRTALLAGLILTTSISVVGAAHFANPDALLLAFSAWALAAYYRYWQAGRYQWAYAAGVACGLALLAKGPIGMLLPVGVVFLFLLWQRQTGRLFDAYLLEAAGLFLLVGLPWYVWVGVETKGQFLRRFLGKDHLERMVLPLEGHSGSVFYYVLVLCVGLFPWSLFLASTVIHTWRRLRTNGDDRAAVRFLTVWLATCFVAFSVVQTKLPNYILPLFPAAALLTAWALERWRAGEFLAPTWLTSTAVGMLGLVGVAMCGGLLVGSGTLPVGGIRRFPELLPWAWFSLVLCAGAVGAGWMLARGRRDGVLVVIAITGVAFVAGAAGWALPALNPHKATLSLAAALPSDHEFREVRLASLAYKRPSLVFYCRREVTQFDRESEARGFLSQPLAAYLFVQETRWRKMAARLPHARVLGRFPDLYGNGEPVLVVTNEAGQSERIVGR